jgi:hypothetical protein
MSEAIKQESKSVLANIIKVFLMYYYFCKDLLLDEEGLEFREEVVYPDGAVYKG